MQPSHVAGCVVGQALDSKSSVTELCLADNELGLDVKRAMLAMRKAGSDVQGVNGQCGETSMACIFRVFAFAYSNSEETNFLRRGHWVSRVFGYCMSLQNTAIQALGTSMGSMALINAVVVDINKSKIMHRHFRKAHLPLHTFLCFVPLIAERNIG